MPDPHKAQELKTDLLCAYLARVFISFPNFQLTKAHADKVEILRDARDTSLLLIDQLENQEGDQDAMSDHEQRLFERCKIYFESPEISHAVHVVKSMKEIHMRLQNRLDRYAKDILTVWYCNFLRNGKFEDRDKSSHFQKDQFQSLVYDSDVRAVFRKHQTELESIFRVYASLDQSDGHVKTMTIAEFNTFLEHCQLKRPMDKKKVEGLFDSIHKSSTDPNLLDEIDE